MTSSEHRTKAESPFGLNVDAWGRLILIDGEGRRYVGAEPVRAFPMSSPGQWVSVVDAEGHEIVLIEDLSTLPDPVRQVLEAELARREFVPEIRKIVRISGDSSPSEWEVVTDRGRTRFTLDSDESLRRLAPNRVIITDARGMRYHIADIRALESASRRKLERYL